MDTSLITGTRRWPTVEGHKTPNATIEDGFNPSPVWKKRIKYIWIMVCLIGMSYHLAVTTIKYFKYEVMSSTIYEFETKMLLPSASICYDVGRIRIPTKFPEGHPCRGPLHSSFVEEKGYVPTNPRENEWSDMSFHDLRRQQCESILLYNHSYTEVYNNLTWDLLETFSLAYTKHLDNIIWFGRQAASETPDRFKQFYKPPMKCLKVTWDEYEEYNMLNSTCQYLVIFVRVPDIRREQHRIPFWDYRAGPMYIYLNDAYSYPKGRDQPDFIMDFNGEVTMSFRPYRIAYLPPPFRFACMNYNSNGIKRKEDCIEKCIRSMNRNRILKQFTLTEFPVVDTRILVKNQTEYDSNYDECSKKCPLSCSTTIFETSENIATKTHKPNWFWMRHDQISFKTKFDQKFPLIEYILFITSILGLWLPFSIFGSTIETIQFIKNRRTVIQSTEVKSNQVNCMKISNFTILFRFVCFVCFLYHSIDLTIEYSKYNTNTIITISNERDIPSVSICERLVWLYRFDDPKQMAYWWSFHKWKPALFNESVHDMLLLTENMTMIEFGFNTGQGFDYYTSKGGWNSDPEVIKKQTEIYIHNTKKCMSFNPPEENTTFQSYKAYTWTQAMGLRFKKRRTSEDTGRRYMEFNLYFHHGKYARGMILPASDYDIDEMNWKTKRYAVTSYETHYLAAPFSHNCLNYQSKGLESSYDCFEKCVDKHWLDYVPNHIAMQMSYSKEELQEPKNRHRKYLMEPPNMKLNTKCLNQCPVDCVTKHYQTNLRSQHATEMLGPTFEIYIELSGLKTHIEYSQTMQFYSYLVLLSGIVALWFGSSIFSLSQDFGKLTYIFMRKNRIYDLHRKNGRKLFKKKGIIIKDFFHSNHIDFNVGPPCLHDDPVPEI